MVKLLVKNGAQIEKLVGAGQWWSAVHVAINHKSVDILKFFIKKGADPRRVYYGMSGFDWASQVGLNLDEIIKSCKTQMADKFIEANRSGKYASAKKVLEKSKKSIFGNIIDQVGSQQLTALYCVAYDNNSDGIKWLVSEGANVSQLIPQGLSPLVVAISERKELAVRALLECGADASATVHGRTMYQFAARSGLDLPTIIKEVCYFHENITKDFVNSVRKKNFERASQILGIRKDVIDGFTTNNFTALYCAVCDKNEESVKWLLEKGADVNKPANEFFTPCAVAVTQKMESMVELLVEHGADLYFKDSDGFDCYARARHSGLDLKSIVDRVNYRKSKIVDDFVIATRKNDLKFAKELLDKRPGMINEYDSNQLTALYCCACDGNLNSMDWLLDRGALVDKTVGSITSLHVAVTQRSVPVVKLLLRRGADPYVKDGAGLDCFRRAKFANDFDLTSIVSEVKNVPQLFNISPVQQPQPMQNFVTQPQQTSFVTQPPINQQPNTSFIQQPSTSFTQPNVNVYQQPQQSFVPQPQQPTVQDSSFRGQSNQVTVDPNVSVVNPQMSVYQPPVTPNSSSSSFSSSSGSFIMSDSMVRSIESNRSSSDFPMDEISTYLTRKQNSSSSSNSSTVSSFAKQAKTVEELMQEKYSNISIIGRGGFGAVFKADKILKKKNAPAQTRAVKLIEFFNTDELNRSLREAFRLCQIQHPHILRVHDAYVLQMGSAGSISDKNTMCIEMEFIPCGDLAEMILKKKICLSGEILKNSLKCMCEALVYLYDEKQMVHRDIKPHNIMIRSINLENNELDIVLGDFGLAKSVGESATSASFAGTLQYMSPVSIFIPSV